MEHLLKSLTNLAFPVQCAGCGQWDTELCRECWLIADSEPTLNALDNEAGIPTVPVFSLGAYEGKLRNIILTAKHDPAANLDAFLRVSGGRLGEVLADELLPPQVVVVPAPPSWKRLMRRGVITDFLAEGVCEGLQAAGVAASVSHAVGLRLGAGSQSNRSKDQRRRGRSGRIRLKRNIAPGTGVLLVDDVYTTGATMQEMCRILGESVVGAAVLARA